jgi:hypothetical protein
MLKALGDLNKKDILSTVIPSAVSSFIVYTVNDLTPYTDLFTDEFLLAHANLHGYNFDPRYYQLLLDLYLTYSDLYVFYGELNEAYNELTASFTAHLLNDFLLAYVGSADLAGDLAGDTEYTENMNLLNPYMDHFMERLDAYMDGITTLGSTLDQIQEINPNFTITLPSFFTIDVSSYHWLLINSLQPNLVFDPHIFTVENLDPTFIQFLASLAGDSNIMALIQRLYSAHYPSLGRLNESPLNRFVNPHVNLFSLERQVLRSRMRTRGQRYQLRGARTRSRSPSRSP